MTAAARREVWLFDVDGTIVDSFDAQHLRPLVAELFQALRASGAIVAVWSAGGVQHASKVIARHGLAGHASGCFDKSLDTDGRWTLPVAVHGEGYAVVCVDDQPAQLPLGIDRRVVVFPYLTPDPHDRALLAELESVTNSVTDSSRTEMA